MALDNTVLKTMTDFLFKEIDGAFLEKPYALSYSHIAIPYHSGNNVVNKGRGTLVIALNNDNPFVTYSYDRFTKINDTSFFMNSLKKLAGTRVRNVSKAKGERIITISLEVKDESIDNTDTGYDLIIELFPMHPNAYIVSYPYGKITSLYKDHGDIMAANYNGRGTKYTYPEMRMEISESLSNLDEVKSTLSRSTYKHFEQYSSSVGFKKALQELVNSKDIYIVSDKIEPLSYGLCDATPIKMEEIYSHFTQDQRSNAFRLREKALIDMIEKSLRVTSKKLNNLIKDIEDAKSHLVYKDYGQLLYMVQDEYVKGMTSMTVEGTKIELDPKLNLVDNAARYFKKYRKSKQAIITLGELIEKTKDEITYLQKKKLDIENGSPRDIQELKEELVLTGYIKDKSKNSKKKKQVKKTYVPHYLILDNGKIGFGLNDLQNETLTFDIARKDSLFFHVVGYPGSHVVILEGQKDKEVQTIACELALFLSHLKEGDVYMTRREFVKKNKEKRGLVNLLQWETITIHKMRDSSIALFKKALKED